MRALRLPFFLSHRSGVVAALHLALIALLLGGCGDRDGYPRDWQPAAIAPDGQCPDITGTFYISDRVAYQSLAGGRFYEEHPRIWSVMSIAGNPQQGLQIQLYETNTGAPGATPVKLNQGSDYRCVDGWMQLPWPGSISMRTEEDNPDDERLMDKSLAFAKNRAGELVIRTDTAHWQGFPIWCGDGCKYVPIPFTRTVSHGWSRWPSVPIPVYQPSSSTVAPEAALDADAQTHAPADETPAGRVTRLLRGLAPLGVRVTGVSPDGERWIGRFQGNADDLIAMHEALMSSGAVADLMVHPVEGRKGSERMIEFSFVATALQGGRKAAETTAAVEQKQAKAVAAQEEEDNRVAKLFLGTLPTGATLTSWVREGDGYQARVQCPDDGMVYTVIVNANVSGHFLRVGLKSKVREQSGMTSAEITLGLD